ncbi:G-protein-signaling modulator 2 isoform X2 [Protopterus annectens]|uniref:G-protein-signaling modulator 2 isoform X2 n=1 Tax=Protopterus annectens TaxID=7888 RepID=UPI001CF97A8B|nr:G-protein-signaling modulator 2 isoform X2 [Protopterus annectens]
MAQGVLSVSMREEEQSFHVRYRMEASCLELALEGERLCKAGDCQAGVSFFEAAVQVGTEDLKILSAIYSQLGNAYFYLQEYSKALEYHHHDLTLARTIGDRIGEAKASGNLGNTLKVLGKYDEAVSCCQRHLDISAELGDKVGEARALYNLGNVYHSKGKSIGSLGAQDPGEFTEDAKHDLQKASNYYEANLVLVQELLDRAAQGRAYGNLGNTHYLLGNFRKAVWYHEQRLLIAKEFGDRAAERRAYSNLGNAYIFLGEFEVAAENYKKTLLLSRQLKDRAVEAQVCYSLGNTYTLLQDYEKAIEYHLKHLVIAQELDDRVGEGKACWSLGNAYTALGNHEQAMHFAERHLDISKEVGDRSGELTARMNLSDLQMVLGLSYSANNSVLSKSLSTEFPSAGSKPKPGRRVSMENLELMKMTPEKAHNWNSEILVKQKPLIGKPSTKLLFVNRLKGKKHKTSSTSTKVLQDRSNSNDIKVHVPHRRISLDMQGDEGFFDLLSRFQSNRMDDQRCALKDEQSKLTAAKSDAVSTISRDMQNSSSASVASPRTDEFLDLLASSQSRRLDEQRASFSNLPGLRLKDDNLVLNHLLSTGDKKEAEEDFFDMLIKCQGSRLDDQRSAPPPVAPKGPTVPDEDFFGLILRCQGKRIDEQRVNLPTDLKRSNTS